jgi:hypothetical protein
MSGDTEVSFEEDGCNGESEYISSRFGGESRYQDREAAMDTKMIVGQRSRSKYRLSNGKMTIQTQEKIKPTMTITIGTNKRYTDCLFIQALLFSGKIGKVGENP